MVPYTNAISSFTIYKNKTNTRVNKPIILYVYDPVKIKTEQCFIFDHNFNTFFNEKTTYSFLNRKIFLKTQQQIDNYIKALYNTDLNALEWHYFNDKYTYETSKEIIPHLEEIIKLKRLKRDLNL